MRPTIRNATVIVRLWPDDDPADVDAWRGQADRIGSGRSGQFNRLDEFIEWLHHELAMIEESGA
jgi:hypothetical protein